MPQLRGNEPILGLKKDYGPRLGKSVHQLPGYVTLAYDLRLTRSIPR
jgi:hypothetical protein